MTHEEKLHIDLLWYQAMEDCVKEDSVRYAFAALVRVDEREACAKVCEEVERKATHQPPMVSQGCQACAVAIRARSNP